jgi:rubrerythrin
MIPHTHSVSNFVFCRECGRLLSSFEAEAGCPKCLEEWKRKERDLE